LTHALRRQLGLEIDKSLAPYAPAVKARMGEVKAGLPSLAGWLKNKVAPELLATQNWQEFHGVCAARGLSVVKVKSGLIFEANNAGQGDANQSIGRPLCAQSGALAKPIWCIPAARHHYGTCHIGQWAEIRIHLQRLCCPYCLRY